MSWRRESQCRPRDSLLPQIAGASSALVSQSVSKLAIQHPQLVRTWASQHILCILLATNLPTRVEESLYQDPEPRATYHAYEDHDRTPPTLIAVERRASTDRAKIARRDVSSFQEDDEQWMEP